MTIATPGTDTTVELNWTKTELSDGRTRHFATASPWTFCINEYLDAPPVRSAELVAHHSDGRGGVTDYNTVDPAKAAALAAMHPSEAMAWLTEDVPGTGPVHTASWGPLYFAAVTTDDGQLRFGYRVDGDLSDEVLNLPGMHDVQQWATGVLIEHYGPVRQVVDVPLPSDSQSPAERLSAALADTQGLRVTEGALHVALAYAELMIGPTPKLSPLSPEERLSRALSASFWTKRSADEVAELLRRAGLTLS